MSLRNHYEVVCDTCGRASGRSNLSPESAVAAATRTGYSAAPASPFAPSGNHECGPCRRRREKGERIAASSEKAEDNPTGGPR